MNILKFRYFSAEDKKFVYSDSFNSGNLQNLVLFFDSALKYSDGEIQQYTGLTDKNGKEIYEWDIIQEFPDSQDKSVIVWSENGFWFAESSESGMGQELFMYPKCQVIGNIFENKSLITKKSLTN